MSDVNKNLTYYHFFKEEELGWLVQHSLVNQDHKVSKENMQERLYDAFEQILPEGSSMSMERVRAKLPAYLQFPGQILPTEAGQIETTIELYIRRHQIEQVNIIFTGTNGGTAKVPVTQFKLALPYMENLSDALLDEEE